MSRLYGRLLPGAAQKERTMRGHRDIGARLSTWTEHLETRLYVGADDVTMAIITYYRTEAPIIGNDAGNVIVYDGPLAGMARLPDWRAER